MPPKMPPAGPPLPPQASRAPPRLLVFPLRQKRHNSERAMACGFAPLRGREKRRQKSPGARRDAPPARTLSFSFSALMRPPSSRMIPQRGP